MPPCTPLFILLMLPFCDSQIVNLINIGLRTFIEQLFCAETGFFFVLFFSIDAFFFFI